MLNKKVFICLVILSNAILTVLNAQNITSSNNEIIKNIPIMQTNSNTYIGIKESWDTFNPKNKDSYLLANGINVTTIPKFGNREREALIPDFIKIQLGLNSSSGSEKSKYAHLLVDGIKTNDLTKIEKALSKGQTINNGLYSSIELGNINFVKYFVDKGANPTNHINYAVKQNNFEIVKYLIDKGARFSNKKIEDIDGQVYLVNANDLNDKIPILIVPVNEEKKWFLSDTLNSYLEAQAKKNIQYLVKYKTKEFLVSNSALIDAIANNNLQIVEMLIKNDDLVKGNAVVIDFYDFKDPYTSMRVVSALYERGSYLGTANNKPVQAIKTPDGYICINETPSPAIILSPIQFAILNNANKNIVDALLKCYSLQDH